MKQHFIHLAVMFAALALAAACSEKGQEVSGIAEEQVGNLVTNVAEVLSFCEAMAKGNDYCVSLDSGDALKITSKSGKSVTVEGSCPVFEVNDRGALMYKKKDTGIRLDVKDTWYSAPDSHVSDDSAIYFMGIRTIAKSSGLYVVDCGKFIYLFSKDRTVAVPSEINGLFNPPVPKDKDVLKVLFVGNSFNQDATQHLPAMLAADGTRKVYLGRTYRGGATVATYLDNYASTDFCSYLTCAPGETSWQGSDGNLNSGLGSALAAQDWDVVTFMEYSGHDDMLDGWDSEADNGVAVAENVNNLIECIFDAKRSKRPAVLFLLTQAFSSQQYVVDSRYDNNPILHYNTIINYGRNLHKNTCIDEIISTCTTIQNLRTTNFNTPLKDGDEVAGNKHELTRDGYHLDYGIGRYAAACTMWYNIFEPALGLDLSTNSFRFSESDEKTTPVTDENAEILRKAAKFASEKPFEVTDMSGMD